MLTIHLNNLNFFAYHGLYEIEKTQGNNFRVDMDVVVDVPPVITRLNQTIDYAGLYKIISDSMQHRTELLETLAQDITDKIEQYDRRIRSVKITIQKLNPPIENFTGTVGVTYQKEF